MPTFESDIKVKTKQYGVMTEQTVIDKYGRVYPHAKLGKDFYVDSVHGAATNDGLSWGTALNKIESAIQKCTANHGDVIWVAPGHNEGITGAAEIDLDIAGISVVGLGTGSLKPTIDFDHQNASVAIGADNVAIANIRFRVSANAVTVGLDIEDGADYAHVDGCEFGWAETATDEFAIALRTNDASNYALIENCLFDAGAQAAVSGIALVKDTEGTIIRNNIFRGAHSTACISGATTLSTNLLIEKNLFYQGATEPAIELLTGTTGVIRDNDIKTNLATMLAAVVADGCFLYRNYYAQTAQTHTGTVMGEASHDDT
jgi:hypothetical protein